MHAYFQGSCVRESHAWVPTLTLAIRSRKAPCFDVRRFYCEARNDRRVYGYAGKLCECFGSITIGTKEEPEYEARNSLNLVYMYIGVGGRANPLPHHKDDTEEIFRREGKSTTTP